MKVSDFPTRLRKLMNENNMSQAELARKTNITPSSISDWLNYKYDAKQDKIDIISRVFNVSPSYMMGYDVDKSRNNLDLNDIPGINVIKNLINVPILGSVICGQPTMMEENFTGYFKLDPDIAKPDFSLRAEGDSMIDANIHEGDLVFFRKTPDVENGSIACVLLDDQVTLKRIIKADDTLILQPANTSYSPIVVRDGDYTNVQILGEMIGVYSTRSK